MGNAMYTPALVCLLARDMGQYEPRPCNCRWKPALKLERGALKSKHEAYDCVNKTLLGANRSSPVLGEVSR